MTCDPSAFPKSAHDPLKFVKAIKGRPFNGYAWVPVGGVRPKKLEMANRDDALAWFGEVAAAELERRKLGRTLLVPIPGSACVKDDDQSRTAILANEIAKRAANADVMDLFRWRFPMKPSSSGGTREAQVLYDNLRVVPHLEPILRKALPGRKVVLVDDVFTLGGHFQAAEGFFRVQQETEAAVGIAAGRTVHEDEGGKPFAWEDGTLLTFNPADRVLSDAELKRKLQAKDLLRR